MSLEATNFSLPPSLLQKALFEFTHVLLKCFLWVQRKIDKISSLLSGEPILKTNLFISAVFVNSHGERVKRF